MKRILGLSFAMFIALVAIALVGGDSGAVAGHGCHGRARGCHGGLLAKLHSRERCHGLFGHKKRGCHGAAAAAPACESGCGGAVESSGCSSCGDAVESSGCSSCGGGEVVSGGAVESSGCSSCGGGEVVGGETVSGGCVGGGCEGSSVITESAAPASEGVPTEAAPAAPAAPVAPAAPAKT